MGLQRRYLGQDLVQHRLQLLSHLRTDLDIRDGFLPGGLIIGQLLVECGNLGSCFLLDIRVCLEGSQLLNDLYQDRVGSEFAKA
jgi:hypothetical protein